MPKVREYFKVSIAKRSNDTGNSVFFVRKDKIVKRAVGFAVYSEIIGEEFFVPVTDPSYVDDSNSIFDQEKLKKGFFIGNLPLYNKRELLDNSVTYLDLEYSDTLSGVIRNIHVVPSIAFYSIDINEKEKGILAPVVYATGRKEIKFEREKKYYYVYSIVACAFIV